MKINIIGGGIIGLFSAYYLQKDGHEVHIFDAGEFSNGCSFGNAGMITPSHFVPMAAPGVVAQGIRWMFNPSSPFYIKPRLDLDLLAWLWNFYRSCSLSKATDAMPVLLDFNLLGKKLYKAFAEENGLDFCLEERGIVMLYQTSKKQKEELATAELANRLGVETHVYDRQSINTLEKGTAVDVLGGVYYPTDAYLHPNLLLKQLIGLLKDRDVRFYGNAPVTAFETAGKRIVAIRCGNEQHEADVQVVAAGSWSAILLKKLGIKLLLQDGKGYSITLTAAPERPSHAAILTEAKVAITPMGNDLRFGGTLELGGLHPSVNTQRVKAILEAVPKYFPRLRPELPSTEKVWYGYRPCTPDGMPYIGKVGGYENLILATGHAMMGLSLGPATGQLVNDIVAEKEIDERYGRFFNPNRF